MAANDNLVDRFITYHKRQDDKPNSIDNFAEIEPPMPPEKIKVLKELAWEYDQVVEKQRNKLDPEKQGVATTVGSFFFGTGMMSLVGMGIGYVVDWLRGSMGDVYDGSTFQQVCNWTAIISALGVTGTAAVVIGKNKGEVRDLKDEYSSRLDAIDRHLEGYNPVNALQQLRYAVQLGEEEGIEQALEHANTVLSMYVPEQRQLQVTDDLKQLKSKQEQLEQPEYSQLSKERELELQKP